MTAFQINPDIIQWACQHLHMTLTEFANALHVSEHIVDAWRRGVKKPTLRQAKEMADKLLIPLGSLVLDELPSLALKAADFRTVGNHAVTNPSLELNATYNMALTRQAWYRDCAIDNEYNPCSCVGSIVLGTPVKEAAGIIRKVLGEEDSLPKGQKWDKRFSSLIESIEGKAGIMVMRNGIVGNNSTRPLSVEEFRGFAIPDEYAPLIFINGQDSRNAQLFTLVHEVVHIFLNCGGISGQDYLEASNNTVEKYCNKVAAEFLVPEEGLLQNWHVLQNGSKEETVYDRIKQLASFYQVSTMVMIIRCRSINLIENDEARDLWQREAAIIRSQKRTGHGGSPYKNIANRVSRLFARSIIWQAESMQIQLGDAFRLLTVKNYSAMQRLSEEVGLIS